jgi:hypothetical protein
LGLAKNFNRLEVIIQAVIASAVREAIPDERIEDASPLRGSQ